MDQNDTRIAIETGRTALGLEFGSTRIKSVLIDLKGSVLATGSFEWENKLIDGLWTFNLTDAVRGMQQSYIELKKSVLRQYGITIKSIGCIGISGMMHGYIALDEKGRQLAPFLTWRNTNADDASSRLSAMFNFNVPMRWTVSQLYQAMIEDQEHLKSLSQIYTLATYIHMRLSGARVSGIGEASGMFPIDPVTGDYNQKMVDAFDEMVSSKGYGWTLRGVLPKVLLAGEDAGKLTVKGSHLLDPEGDLVSGIPMAPPEGDAGTGMVATNSVAERTGNVSVGTSVFSMSVLERPLSKAYRDIDIVCTPTGKEVAMVHCNNGTSNLDRWIGLFNDMLESFGIYMPKDRLYERVFRRSLDGDASCGGIASINFISGEPVAGVLDGRPLVATSTQGPMAFSDFIRSQMYSIFASLVLGHRILESENVVLDRLTGHGGYFKVDGVGQRHLSAALGVPVTVMGNSGEGGPYGMALLAAFRISDQRGGLEGYLEKVFSRVNTSTVMATDAEMEGFKVFMKGFNELMDAEKALLKHRK